MPVETPTQPLPKLSFPTSYIFLGHKGDDLGSHGSISLLPSPPGSHTHGSTQRLNESLSQCGFVSLETFMVLDSDRKGSRRFLIFLDTTWEAEKRSWRLWRILKFLLASWGQLKGKNKRQTNIYWLLIRGVYCSAHLTQSDGKSTFLFNIIPISSVSWRKIILNITEDTFFFVSSLSTHPGSSLRLQLTPCMPIKSFL